MSLANLNLSLVISALDRATEPLRRVSESLEKVEHRTEKLHHAMHKLGAAEFIGGALFTGALLEGGHALFEMTEKTSALGVELLHMSQKTGATVEQLARLRYAAKQLGGDPEGLSQVFFRLETHLANAIAGSKETRGALKLLGIGLRETKQLAKDPYEAFLRLSEGFHEIHNPTLRAKLAMDLFSRSGVQLLPMLRAGREEIEKFGNDLKAMNGVMSGETARKSEEFEQQLNKTKLALRDLTYTIGGRLLAPMTALLEKITDLALHLRPEFVDRFTRALDGIIAQLPKLLELIEQLIEWVGETATKVIALTDRLGGLRTVLSAVALFIATQAAVAFVTLAFSIAKVGLAALTAGPMILALIPEIGSLTEAMVALDLAMDANPVGVIALAIAGLIAAVAGVIVVILNWGAIMSWLTGVLTGFVAWFKKLPLVFKLLAAPITLAIFLFQNWGKIVHWLQVGFEAFWKLMQGLGQWIASALPALWKGIEAMMPPWLMPLLKMMAAVGGATFKVAGSIVTQTIGAIPLFKPGGFDPLADNFMPDAPGFGPGPGGAKPFGGNPPSAPAGAQAKPDPARMDLHLHLTTDGKAEVKKMSATGDGMLTVHRGQIFA